MKLLHASAVNRETLISVKFDKNGCICSDGKACVNACISDGEI